MENKKKFTDWDKFLGLDTEKKPQNKPNSDLAGFDEPERADELEMCE